MAWHLKGHLIMVGPSLGKSPDLSVVTPVPSAATFLRGGSVQCHPGGGVLALHCAASANRREMGFLLPASEG